MDRNNTCTLRYLRKLIILIDADYISASVFIVLVFAPFLNLCITS